MKRITTAMLICLMSISCSGIGVKKISANTSAIREVKKVGFLVRISRDVRLTRDDYVKTISHWFAGFVPLKDILFIADGSEKITFFNTNEHRFYQVNEAGEFLKFKSIGVVNLYLRDNRAELKKIIDDNSLDGIFVYEIYGVIANEMQFVDYDTMLVMADKDLKVIYMDMHRFSDDSNELDFDRIKIKFLDGISERVTKTLVGLGFLGR
ncbi:MAG: hypothetical protein N2316_05970 [Spirochaetes bacterium]|nr:hypothetical protein [Spirochaetota bacterium]